MKYLLEHGADVRLREKNGETALSIALDNDQLDIVGQLRRAGATMAAKKKTTSSVGDEDNEEEETEASTPNDFEDLLDEEDIPDDVDLDED